MDSRTDAASRRDVIERAFTVIAQLERRLAVAERAGAEPVAIVGMDCRFPGSANDPEAYWRALESGVDATRPYPPERGATAGRPAFGAFVDEIDQFDAGFFGITPREARMMDPQQRLLLETSWRALEHAGQAPDRLAGTRTGVFVGMTMLDYVRVLEEAAPEVTDVYAATGNALNTAAGRVSFVLGLQGPCLSIDTACSSSLVAVHTACRSLRARDCDLALAGGVNVILMQRWSDLLSSWGLMAADGRCKTFDASADGFVRSEGCGMLVLRRLSDAEARGDRILAVILGSAVNHDGHSSGLTVPNGLAQQALIRAALDDAGVSPDSVDYVEAHGTGTPVGDPIEVEALAQALGQGRSAERPLLIGSVKTNIGHPEAASGVAGLMKVVLGLQHQAIPRHLHFRTPSPAIEWSLAPLRVVTETTAWPETAGRRRIAGVSSFGFSGTNAHVIVAEAPKADAAHRAAPAPVQVLTMSARHPASLRELAAEYARRLPGLETADWAAVCYSANTGRARMAERLAVAARSPQSMASALESWLRKGTAPALFQATRRPSHAPKVAFLFTGQGSQYAGMGRQLYERSAVVRAALDDCAQRLAPHMDRPLLEVMFGAESARIDDTAYAQPALFALEYALATLWRRCGVTADVVVGHSIGEIVAATVAGALTLDDGLRLVAARGRLMQQLPRNGAMAAVFADYAAVETAIADVRDQVAVAAVNGPGNVVISGGRDAVADVCTRLHAAGVKHVPLAVSHAFHSPLMEPILEQLESVASGIRYGTPVAVLLSNVSGGRLARLDAAYWRRHAREAVQFLANARQLEREGVEVAIELGPATLGGMVERALPPQTLATVATIRRGQDEWETLGEAAAKLDAAGVRIDWTGLALDPVARRVEVPTTPFRRQRFWIAAEAPSPGRPDRPESGSALAGASVRLASRPSVSVAEQVVSLERFPFLADHRVRGLVVVPATAYVEMVAAAVAERAGWRPIALDDIAFTSAMLLEPAVERLVQVTLEGTDHDLRFTVHSRPRAIRSATWNEHATGRVRTLAEGAVADARVRMAAGRGQCAEPLDREQLYARLTASGNQFGPAFQGVRTLSLGPGAAHAVIETPPVVGDAVQDYLFHPAVADSFGHALVAAALGGQDRWVGEVVGSRAREIRLYRPLRTGSFEVSATLTSSAETPDAITGNVLVIDAAGELVSETCDIRMQVLGDRTGTASTDDWWYRIDWEPSPPAAPAGAVAGPLVVVSADVVAAELLSRSLDAPPTSVERIDRDEAGAPVPIARHRAEAVVARLREAQGEGGHIVYLCANDPEDFASVDALENRILGDCGSVLHLAQALADAPPATGRLWVITRQAVQVAGEPVAIAQAPLWGLGRCLATDCGAAWGGLIDVDATMPPAALARELSRVLAAGGPERQLAIRDRVFVPRLARSRPSTGPEPLAADPDGAYLVTGGLGGLGLAVADWLVRRGVRHLTLVSRRALPPREAWDDSVASEEARAAITAIRALERAGATVRVAAADIGDAADVRWVLDACAADGVPLRAVFHTAGATEHSQLSRQNVDGFRRMFAGKLRGAWLLERLCPEAELVLFSSGSAVFGPPYLGAYAAANAFLDGLALRASAVGRRRRVVSVNWGAWGEVGMAARAEARDGRSSDLARAMTPAQGIAALEHVLACDIPSVAIVPIDWAKWRQHGATRQPFFARLAEASLPDPVAPTSAADSAPPTPSSPGLSDDQQALLEEFARVMELPTSVFDLDEPLIALGVDSLMAVELRTAIERSHGISIALDHLLGGATARQILEQVALKAPMAQTAAAGSTLMAEEEGHI